MIPEGWQQLKIGEIGRVVTGNTPPTGRAEFYGGSVPFVAPGDLGRTKYVISAEKTLTEEGRKVSRPIPAGATLFTCIGSTIGKLGMAGVPLTTNQQINAVIPGKAHDPEFVYYQLARMAPRIARLAGTQAVPLISKKQFAAEKILVAPSAEQKRIREALETWDHAIERVEALIANARAQKQALMQQLLPQGTIPPKKRLPGFSGEWREIRLGAAFSERVERGEDGLALLSVTQASGVIPQEDAGRRNISSADQSNYKTVCAGDIAYNTMRMWQGASALSGLTGKVSPAYTVVTPRNGHDALFYSYLFKQPKMIHVFERHSQGLVSDTWNLKFPHFAKIRICVPGIEEQVAIAAAFKSLDDLTVAYETQLAALRQEKAALMQQLLTGKRRVKLQESEVA